MVIVARNRYLRRLRAEYLPLRAEYLPVWEEGNPRPEEHPRHAGARLHAELLSQFFEVIERLAPPYMDTYRSIHISNPHQEVEAIADRAVAELAEMGGSLDPSGVLNAERWLKDNMTWCVPGHDRESENRHLQQGLEIRGALLRSLATHGRIVPDEIRFRSRDFLSDYFLRGGYTPPTNAELFAWLAPSTDSSTAPDSPTSSGGENTTTVENQQPIVQPASVPPPPAPPDGPFDRIENGVRVFGLRLGEYEHPFTSQEESVFKLVRVMWPFPATVRTVSEVREALGSNAEHPKWASNLARKTLEPLSRCGLTHHLRADKDRVWWVPFDGISESASPEK